MSNNKQPTLIITGMHRSGSSLTSGLLQSAGLDIGKNLVPGNQGNPKGHFENIDFVNFHESVLYSLGIDKIGWTVTTNITPPPYYLERARKLIKENTSLNQPWGWKEPRTTLFLNFWANLLPEAKFLFVYRAPWEVLDSLYRRGDDIFHCHPEFALQVWMSYNHAILDFYYTQSERCLLTNIDAIIEKPTWLTKTIADKLSISLSEPDCNLYDRCLLRKPYNQFQRPQIIQRHFPEAFQLYCDLNKAANYTDRIIAELEHLPSSTAWVLQDWLDVKRIERDLEQKTTDYQGHLERVSHQLEESQARAQANQSQIEQLQQQLQELTQTRSQFERSQQELAHTRSQLEQRNSELATTQIRLTESQERIIAMESSKFWQIRKLWFKFKSILGFDDG